MKDHLSTPLSYDERIELIPALSDVAKMYYDHPNQINMFAGICYQLVHFASIGSAYSKMTRLMREIGYTEDDSYFEGDKPVNFKDYEDWEPRAYMCLFLSEYLMSTLVVKEDEPELAAEQSTWDKIKDKVKSLFTDHVFELQWNGENGIVTKTN